MTTASHFLFNTGAIGNETSDEELVRKVLAGAAEEFAVLMDRHSQRLYRVCRSIVADDAEAEAAVQEAYSRAYRHLEKFNRKSKFAVWLTKIAVFEALVRRRLSSTALQESGTESRKAMRPQLVSKKLDSDQEAASRSDQPLFEEAIDALPANYRSVFVLRHLEALSAEETAACLLLSRETVETRLAHAMQVLEKRLRPHLLNQPAEHTFPFRGALYAALRERVMKTIR